jgi:CRISPR-associated protein Csm1
MDETVLKIALAGLLHDIGKFAEDGMYVSPEFLKGNADLYQPFFKENHTHRHAVYTAAFIDHIEKLLPRQFNKAGWGLDDPFINLAAGHHKPKTPMQWVIAMADRVSSGWDRNNFDPEYNQAIAWQDYRKTRLLPLFERLLRDDKKERGDYGYRYPLKEITPQNIFPLKQGKPDPLGDEEAAEEYKNLFDEFIFALEKLYHKDVNVELWFEHLDSLFLIYTSMIPAARAGKVLPDVSLYDHSRTVSALASALYLYHFDTDTMTIEAIRDYDSKKFLLVGGDFYGIQNFIYSDSGEAGKNRAKILRGRSFAVSLYSELAADMLCREIGLPPTAILLNAAGKFTLIAPNTISTQEGMKSAEDRVNRWLMEIAYGESTIGFSTVEAAPSDFVSGKFIDLWDRLADNMAARKFSKFAMDQYGGPVTGYLDSFKNDLNPPLCPYCGKRPASSEAESSKQDRNDKSMCGICRDHIFLGENLVKQERIAITAKDADLKGTDNKLLVPIFDEYQVAFIGGGLNELARKGKVLKYWDISINEDGRMSKDLTARFLNGYVPVYREEDLDEGRYLEGKKSDEKKLAMVEEIRVDRERKTPKTFAHIAAKAQNEKFSNEKKSYCGIQAIGVLKADVDQLGMLMACGLTKEEFTLSRLATLSRQMNFFFAVFLPHLLKTNPRFNDVYTVFAGGDDLLLIGPWNRVMDLADILQERFADYTCRNKHIHFSAGISLEKPNTPLDKLAKDAEGALEKAKDSGRERITVFGETATWTEYAELREIRNTLKEWRESDLINNAMIFRMNAFISLAEMAKEILKEKEVHLEDMEYLKWRALFSYSTERNIGRNLKDEAGKVAARNQFGKAAEWLEEYGGRLRIALWDFIYNTR